MKSWTQGAAALAGKEYAICSRLWHSHRARASTARVSAAAALTLELLWKPRVPMWRALSCLSRSTLQLSSACVLFNSALRRDFRFHVAERHFRSSLEDVEEHAVQQPSAQHRATVAAMKRDLAKAMSMQVCNTCQPAQIPNNSAMRDQTLRHVAARLQGKLTEAFDSLRHALAIYDGHPFDCTIALTETHYLREPTYTLEAAAHSAVPPGVPPDVLLNILDNLASHASQLHGGHPAWLQSRAVLLERALAVRLHHGADPQRTREELAIVSFRTPPQHMVQSGHTLGCGSSFTPSLPAGASSARPGRRCDHAHAIDSGGRAAAVISTETSGGTATGGGAPPAGELAWRTWGLGRRARS